MKARIDLDGNIVLTAESVAEWVLLDYDEYQIKLEDFKEESEEDEKVGDALKEIVDKFEREKLQPKTTQPLPHPAPFWYGDNNLPAFHMQGKAG